MYSSMLKVSSMLYLIDPFCADVKITLAVGKTKEKLEVANSNQHRFGYTRSLKYNLVVMLGARIDVVQPPIRNLIAYLLPLPDKKPTTAVVKRDKTSGLDRNDRQKCSRLQAPHTSYQKRFNKVLSFVVMDYGMVCVTCLKISYASHDYVVYEIMSGCMCIKQQTDDLYA